MSSAKNRAKVRAHDRARGGATRPARNLKDAVFHGNVENPPPHGDPEWAVTLRKRITDPDFEQAKLWCAETLKPVLAKRIGGAAESWYDALQRLYAVGVEIEDRPKAERRALLRAMDLPVGKKNIFLVLINEFWLAADERKERKTAQSRHSRWASALRGAALMNVSIAHFPEVLKREGLEGLAAVAKAEARKREAETREASDDVGAGVPTARPGLSFSQIRPSGAASGLKPARGSLTPARRKAPLKHTGRGAGSTSTDVTLPRGRRSGRLSLDAGSEVLDELHSAHGWYPAVLRVEGTGDERTIRLAHLGRRWQGGSSEPDFRQFDELTDNLTVS